MPSIKQTVAQETLPARKRTSTPAQPIKTINTSTHDLSWKSPRKGAITSPSGGGADSDGEVQEILLHGGRLYELHEIKINDPNPYLLTGYTGHLTHCGCINSALYPNNQFWNIWTAFAGVIGFFFVTLHVFASTRIDPYDRMVLGSNVFMCFLMNVVSCGAHMFSAISTRASILLFAADWLFIGLLFCSRAWSFCQFNFPFPQYATPFFFAAVAVNTVCFSIAAAIPAFWPHLNNLRSVVVVPAVVFQNSLIVVKFARGTLGFDSLLGLIPLVMGILMYALKWPERALPRAFDLGLYSHPLWHIAYNATCYLEALGMLADFCVEKGLQETWYAHRGSAIRFPLFVFLFAVACTVVKLMVAKQVQKESCVSPLPSPSSVSAASTFTSQSPLPSPTGAVSASTLSSRKKGLPTRTHTPVSELCSTPLPNDQVLSSCETNQTSSHGSTGKTNSNGNAVKPRPANKRVSNNRRK